MTREEAIRELKQFSGTTRLRLSANFWEALNRAIKSLEQEPILDKIKVEIKQHRRKTKSIDPYDLVGDCLGIIDKYMEESEDK